MSENAGGAPPRTRVLVRHSASSAPACESQTMPLPVPYSAVERRRSTTSVRMATFIQPLRPGPSTPTQPV